MEVFASRRKMKKTKMKMKTKRQNHQEISHPGDGGGDYTKR
jgi:hypothetical protein